MKSITFTILILLIQGCSSQNNNNNSNINETSLNNEIQNKNNTTIHYYVEQLTQQMLLTSQTIKLNQSIAIGTFLPLDEINYTPTPSSLGHQIQESFMTLLTQAGLNVIEFKTTQSIKIKNNTDVMLSRDINDLKDNVAADYYLTGNYTQQENSFIVNARLIEINSQKVIAAATDHIPLNTIWGHRKTILKSNNIYRGAY